MHSKSDKHKCTALILHCIDFRLGSAIKNYLQRHNLLDDCDIVAMAGAAKNIARPKEETDREFALRQIRISIELHRIEKVIVMNHTDCGAYGGRRSDEDSEWQHVEDMKTAKDAILGIFDTSNLAVNLTLARIDEYNNVQIVEIAN